MSKNQVAPATVGRVVWVWLGGDSDPLDFNVMSGFQPFRADVVYVNKDGTINVNGQDHQGTEFYFESVPLENPDAAGPDCHFSEDAEITYATWMPYQQKQHEKQAEESNKTPQHIAKQNSSSQVLIDGKDV